MPKLNALEELQMALDLVAEEMGRKGGKSRAANMTPAQRSDAARAAANARWAGKAKKKAGGKKGK